MPELDCRGRHANPPAVIQPRSGKKDASALPEGEGRVRVEIGRAQDGVARRPCRETGAHQHQPYGARPPSPQVPVGEQIQDARAEPQLLWTAEARRVMPQHRAPSAAKLGLSELTQPIGLGLAPCHAHLTLTDAHPIARSTASRGPAARSCWDLSAPSIAWPGTLGGPECDATMGTDSYRANEAQQSRKPAASEPADAVPDCAGH